MIKHEEWMKLAFEQAAIAGDRGEVPIGAILVIDDECIARSHNSPITDLDPTAHAEIQVIREAGKTLGNYRYSGATLYVTLEPCLMCIGAMVHARINHCIFGAFDPKTGAAISQIAGFELPFHNHHINFTGGILAEECSQVLRNFFQSKR